VLAIVDPTDLWIEANFKETDLEYVRAGQPVEVELDTYSHRVWQGKVESISQATGAEFAVLPPQNASGNWVKVVQRVTVRVRIERRADDPPLRAGMSATVKIDTGDRPLRERLFGAR
jgi:membrane fusion protein (multidrug efflux system)